MKNHRWPSRSSARYRRPGRPLFDVGENRRTGSFRARKVSIDIVDEDEHAIDDPRHRRPFARLLAGLSMSLRALVVRRGRREHDQSARDLHLAV